MLAALFSETISRVEKCTYLYSEPALSAALCGTPRALPSGARRGLSGIINSTRTRVKKVEDTTNPSARIAQREHAPVGVK